MKTKLQECAEYHDQAMALAYNLARAMEGAGLDGSAHREDVKMHQEFALACREADGAEKEFAQ